MVESENGVRLPSSPDTADLALGETAPPGEGRREPVLASSAPRGEFDEVIRLDPTRGGFEPEPPPVGRGWPRGPIDSLILHLLALVMIIGWPSQTPANIPAPIPVELVIEPPPPSQMAEPKPPANPLQGRRASEDIAEALSPKLEKGAGDAARSAGEPQPPGAETQSTAAPPLLSPAEPDRPAEPASADPQPPAAETQVATVAPPLPPKPAAAKPMPQTQATVRTPKPLGSAWPLPLYQDHPQVAAHLARLTGPSAARDEYCARLLSLTLRNIALLPLAAIGTRHGETTVTFRLGGDGTLNSVKVARSSGYSDIDEKIAQMVIAVGSFPPLPQWIPGSWMDFTFDLHFPHPLQR
jgi:TonB family protein